MRRSRGDHVGCILVAAAIALATLPACAEGADDRTLCLTTPVSTLSSLSVDGPAEPGAHKKVFDRVYDLKQSCTAIIESRKSSQIELATAFVNRGIASRILHDFDAAIADLDQAIRRNPELAIAYSNRGMAYQGKQDYDHAIADYDQAIRRDPKLIEAYSARAEGHWQQVRVRFGDDADVEGDLARVGHVIGDRARAFQLDPTNEKLRDSLTRALVYRGHLYEYDKNKRKDLDRALADYSEAVRVDPKNYDALSSRCDVYTEMNDFDRAVADCKEALRLHPEAAMAMERQLMSIELRRGR